MSRKYLLPSDRNQQQIEVVENEVTSRAPINVCSRLDFLLSQKRSPKSKRGILPIDVLFQNDVGSIFAWFLDNFDDDFGSCIHRFASFWFDFCGFWNDFRSKLDRFSLDSWLILTTILDRVFIVLQVVGSICPYVLLAKLLETKGTRQETLTRKNE